MKKKVLIILLLFPIFVFADSLKFNTYQQCFDFQSGNLTANGTGEYKYCMKAKCENQVWQSSFLYNKNTLVCANGNTDFYYYVVSSGCSDYVGTCNTNNSLNYCGMVVRYDCNKINNGSIYVSKKTTTSSRYTSPILKPTTKTTSRRTTNKVTTTTTTTTAVPVTESIKDSNNYLKSLNVKGYSIKFNKEDLSYNLVIDRSVDNLEIEYETESDKATVTVTNDKDINIASPVIISVTAEDGSKKDYTISLSYKTLSSNTNVKKMTIDNYEFIFDQTKHDYDLIIKNEDSSLVYNIELEDDNALYEIEGNNDLVNGSEIVVKIVAEDGTENDYKFNIIKESVTKPSKKKNSALISILIIMILAIIGFVAFKFIRNILPAKKDEKYDYE